MGVPKLLFLKFRYRPDMNRHCALKITAKALISLNKQICIFMFPGFFLSHQK